MFQSVLFKSVLKGTKQAKRTRRDGQDGRAKHFERVEAIATITGPFPERIIKQYPELCSKVGQFQKRRLYCPLLIAKEKTKSQINLHICVILRTFAA